METNKVVFLKGNWVTLRPLRKSTDIDQALVWINDEEIRKFISAFQPVSHSEEEEWFDSIGKKKDSIHFAIEAPDGTFIGVISLHRINWQSRTAVTGALIGEKQYQGKGYGTDAKMALLKYAFCELNLRKISSHALEYNARSISYSKKCGYKIEGILKKHIFKGGKYWNEVILSVYKKDWLPLWRAHRVRGKS